MTAEQRKNYIEALCRETEMGLVDDEEFAARAAAVSATDEEIDAAMKVIH